MAIPALTLMREGVLVPLYSIVMGLCIGTLGVLLGLFLCDVAFDTGLIRANADIDDDAALITMGFAMFGGLAGFVAGAALGAVVIWPRQGLRPAGGIDR